MSAQSIKIAQVAKSKVGSSDWKYSEERGDFPKNTNKCNLFVYEVAVAAGATPPTVPRYVIFNRPPTAGEWATPSVSINGWTVVTDPQPGDVVAEAHNYADATGHVGIVTGDKLTTSASALVGGVIVENDWGFRSDNHPTFRHCTT